MKEILTFHFALHGTQQCITIGHPDSKDEYDAMFSLRFRVYSAKGYIDPQRFPEGIEQDEYDDKRSVYFIAKFHEEIVGTVRLIRSEFLPTEQDCFHFEEPAALRSISRLQRGEISRLIVVPYKDTLYFPRNILMLLLFNALMFFGNENVLLGGYSFATSSLVEKLKKLKFPFHPIERFETVWNKGHVLRKYFEKNKIIPFYFLTSEVQDYIQQKLLKTRVLHTQGEHSFVLSDTLYTRFLKHLDII